jgi:drug/metabolite transporter (DMT)-like permease
MGLPDKMIPAAGHADINDASARFLGIILTCCAWFVFSGVDASGKYLTALYAVGQIVLIRYGGGLIYSLFLIAAKGNFSSFRSARLGLQITRATLLAAATTVNFIALRYLQLDQTAAIMFAIPLVVCVLSVPILGETIGWRRWTAVLVGLLGVLIIIRPGFATFHWAMLLVLIQATCAALYMILTRKVSAYDRNETSLFYTGLIGTLLTLPFGIMQWQPVTGETWLPVLVLGFCGGLGHHLVIAAHRLAPAPIVAPFGYTHIIWMTLLGYLLFNQLPDAFTLLGASVVICCGLFLLYRERQLNKHPAPQVH